MPFGTLKSRASWKKLTEQEMLLDHPNLYQPPITRLPSLLSLLTSTLTLIALIELACRRLPYHSLNDAAALLPRDLNAADAARHSLAQLQHCMNV